MSDTSNPQLHSGPAGRSNSMLRSIIDELAQKEILLGKHIKSVAPTKPLMTIEYESLIFEDPPESAIMKSIRTGAKNVESSTIEGPNCNKIGYKNMGLWSPRSIKLEQLMKPLLNISVSMWPDYESFNEILSQADVTEGNMKIAMVDTLLVRMNEAHEVRYGFDRLYSHWSYASNQFEVRKEWVDKIELDILVLSLINDHTASLQLKKEQDRLGGMQRQTQSHTSASATATLSAASKIHKLVSAIGVNPNASGSGVKRKVLSEGECRTHAVLKAVCRDGSVHIRPLCTSGDVLLALHELLDPVIFIHGCIQLPHVLSDVFARHTEGFYRYIYTINEPGQWQYLRIVLPAHLHSLHHFIQPSYVDTHSAFHIENITPDCVPAGLRDVSIHITKLVVRHYGKAQLLQRMVVDFEVCMDITQGDVKVRRKKKTNTNTSTVNANTNTTNTTHANTSTSKTHTTTNNDLYGANIPAPHLQTGDAVDRNYHFRLLYISETQFVQCWAGQRRDAVCYMHPATKIQLRNFESYFIEAWELRKREHNKQKAELFMSQQSASIKHIGNTTTPGNTSMLGVLNLNVKSIGSDSMSPMNSGGGTSGVNGGSSVGGVGGGSSGRGTLRVSSHTPFSPFSPIRSVRTDTIGSFSPTATNSYSGNSTSGSVRGSMLRPGSTISTKGIPNNNHGSSISNRQSVYDTNTSTKLTINTNTSGKLDNTFMREMMTNPRSAKNQPRKPDQEAEPAKLDAIHLVNILFPRKYKPIVVKKRRGSDSSDSGDSGSENEGSVGSAGSGSDSSVLSGSNSGSSIGDDSEAELEPQPTHNTIFQFVPLHTTNTNTVPSAIISAHKKRTTKSEKVRFAPNDIYTKPPLSRTTNTSNLTTKPVSLVRGTGTIIKQTLQLNGVSTKRPTFDTTTTNTNTTTPDAAILAKYHITEKQRQERDKRRADERRIQQDIVNKLLEEKQQAEVRKQAGNSSLFFVTRTNIKAVDVAVPSVVNSVNSGSGLNTSSSGGMQSPLRTTSSGGTRTNTNNSANNTTATGMSITTNNSTLNTNTNNSGSGTTSPTRTNSPSTTLRKSVSDYRTARAIAIADAQRERRKLRRGATQSLDISTMDSDTAQRIFDEEDRRYRDTLDGVADTYLDNCEPMMVDSNTSTIHNTPYDVDTVVDKELYFSVDSIARSVRANSPDKVYKPVQRTESLSPLKMYAEMNRTADEVQGSDLYASSSPTHIGGSSGGGSGVRVYTTHSIHPISVHTPSTVHSVKHVVRPANTTAHPSTNEPAIADVVPAPNTTAIDTLPTTHPTITTTPHTTCATHATRTTHTATKTRNDTEFNNRAYTLASKLDLTYLVSQFNPADHSRDKTIILEEERKLHNNTDTSNTTTTNTENTTEVKVELTPAEKRQQAKEYANFMKQLYEEEMSLMMDKMVEKLPDKLASKVRKALLAQQLKTKLKRRKEFIQRRRKIEVLLPTEITALTHYYESNAFDQNSITDSSSEDEATKRRNDKDMNSLLGDYNVDEATMAAMLAARAAEEQAELDAAEAKRLRRESYLSSKAAEAQAREDKRCADLALAAIAAEDAVYNTDAPDAPFVTPESGSRKSAAQMRKTIRTYSLMQVTKVLLDGTLVPEVSGKINTGDSDGESEAKSRPGTSKRYDENGNIITTDTNTTTNTEESTESGMVRPRSRPQSQPFSRPSLWGMPPMSWRGNSVLLNTGSEEILEENSMESDSFGQPDAHRVERVDNRVENRVGIRGSNRDTNGGVDSGDSGDSGSERDTAAATGTVSEVHSLRAVAQRVMKYHTHHELVVGALGHELEAPKHKFRDAVKRLIHSGQPVSSVVGSVGGGESEQIHTLAAVAVHNIIDTAADTVLRIPTPITTAPTTTTNANPTTTTNTTTTFTPTAPTTIRSRAASYDNALTSESHSNKEQSPRRKLSFSVKVPTAVMPRVVEPVQVSGEKSELGVVSSGSDAVLVVEELVGVISQKELASGKLMPALSEKIHIDVPLVAPPTPTSITNNTMPPLVRTTSTKTSKPTLFVPEQVSFKAPLFEEPSITSTLTGPESDFIADFSRENSEFDLHDVHDLLRTVHRPETIGVDSFVHKRSPRVAVSNSIMKSSTDGRPPSGIVYNMVKPPISLKPSPMDKVNSAKGLPVLKKPYKKQHDTYNTTTTTTTNANTSPSHRTKPTTNNTKHTTHTDDRDNTKLSEEPTKPKGLYLIPGAAVASFVQKPPAEKAIRPIVYTTRVLMEQKIREYMNDTVPDNLTVSTLTFSEPPTPFENTTMSNTHGIIAAHVSIHGTNVTDGISQVTGHSLKPTFNDSYVAPVVDMAGVMSGYADDLAYAELSGELLQLSGELMDDSCHNITTTQLSSYDHTEFVDQDSDSPHSPHSPTTFNNTNPTTNTTHPSNTNTNTTSTNQSEDDSQLRLNTAEWQLILTAAREQAHILDLDIVSQDEFVPPQSAPDVRDIQLYDDLPQPEQLASGVVADSHVLHTAHTNDTDPTPWRLARLGEENFNWRSARIGTGERSVVIETELDDSDVDTSPGNSPKSRYGYNFGQHAHNAYDTYGTTVHRAPQTLEGLLAQLGVVPYKHTSPVVSPPVSPGRAAHKNIFTVPLHMHSLNDPPHTNASHAHTLPNTNTSHPNAQTHVSVDESVLHITKSHYSKKPDPPPQRAPYVRPSSAHKAKSSVVEGGGVKQVEIKVPVVVVEKEPDAVATVAPADDVVVVTDLAKEDIVL